MSSITLMQKQGLEILANLSKVTKLVKSKTGTQVWTVLDSIARNFKDYFIKMTTKDTGKIEKKTIQTQERTSSER